MAAVTVDHVYKSFPGKIPGTVLDVLDDVSLSIEQNEFVCILGPSGCGKSTLLRALANLEAVDSGTIALHARPSVVFQETGIYPWMSVEKNVSFPLRARGVRPAQRKALVDPLLDMVGLSTFRKYHPHQLSGGMRQRVSVARALADDGDLLLMDEPFGALDEQTRVSLQQELLRIWSTTHKSVLFITHSVDEALTLADRVLVMSARPGRIIAEIEVPFPRPRNILELRRLPELGEITYELWQLLDSDRSETAS